MVYHGFLHGANWTFIYGVFFIQFILIYRVIDNFLDYKKYISPDFVIFFYFVYNVSVDTFSNF